jgi:hypothetical protein
VVHALETLHAALRPQGLLLDVRPGPRHPLVAIQRGTAVDGGEHLVRVGKMDVSYRIKTLVIADAAVQTLIDAGRFVREQVKTFTFIYHFDSVETWLAYMAEHWSNARISARLIARARDELSAGAGELRILRAVQASRLRRT